MTKTADLITFKIHINSVISTRGARYSGWDIIHHYHETNMGRLEYMIIHIILILSYIIAHYNLNDLVDQDGCTYMEIIRVMYGLPQAGILAKNLFAQRLSNRGYYQVKNIRIMW